MSEDCSNRVWPLGSAEGRWKGFGPYYAMFPVDFARDFIDRYSKPGDTIIDPFCGRGTSNYVAKILERNSIGCDVNPVAWVYSKAKTDPVRQTGRLMRRVREIWESQTKSDRESENEFQKYAWSKTVLTFLNSARRELDWKCSKTDWTLAGIILVYLHGKLGGGLSNQMRQSKSMAPDYAVRWWKQRNMFPPEIDPVRFLKERILWRYEKGLVINKYYSKIYLGDARKYFNRQLTSEATLLITSPPYMGVTNYEYDNWIRLWALGGPAQPTRDQSQRYGNKDDYQKMIRQVFRTSQNLLADDACIVVRTDRRRFTLETTANAMYDIWPQHKLFGRKNLVSKPTQTALFGDKTEKPGEIDLISLPKGEQAPESFIDFTALLANEEQRYEGAA